MTDGTICDRCGDAESYWSRQRGFRSSVIVEYLSSAATAHENSSYELCDECTVELCEWMGVEVPQRFASEVSADG